MLTEASLRDSRTEGSNYNNNTNTYYSYVADW